MHITFKKKLIVLFKLMSIYSNVGFYQMFCKIFEFKHPQKTNIKLKPLCVKFVVRKYINVTICERYNILCTES